MIFIHSLKVREASHVRLGWFVCDCVRVSASHARIYVCRPTRLPTWTSHCTHLFTPHNSSNPEIYRHNFARFTQKSQLTLRPALGGPARRMTGRTASRIFRSYSPMQAHTRLFEYLARGYLCM